MDTTREAILDGERETKFIFRKITQEEHEAMVAYIPQKENETARRKFKQEFGFHLNDMEGIGIISQNKNDFWIGKCLRTVDMGGPHGNGVWVPSGKIKDVQTHEEYEDHGGKLKHNERRLMTQKILTPTEALLAKVKHLDATYGVIYRIYA